ncbi:hypothetical protein [Aeromicrobium sp. 179-A 4D2 NHS]|uniref:hypothetical protein n=1 Tax=Aeromicrobium sp. 179-A 4D2 NHS TaxID=3142375 RepID=UPI0039A1A171
MKRSLLALAAASALLLTGCASDSNTAGKTGFVERILAGPLTYADIDDALLTVDDLPAGWSVDPDGSDDGDDSKTSSDSPECDLLVAAMEADDDSGATPVGEGEATFRKSKRGPFLLQSITSFEGNEAKKSVKAFRTAFETCDSFTETGDDGTKVTFKVSPMAFPSLGDDTVALRLSARSAGIRVVAPLIVVRVDQNLMLLASAGIKKRLPAEDLETVARTAVTKIKAAN